MFHCVAEPGVPLEPSLEVDSSTMLLTVTWMPPENVEQFDLLNYTVVLTSTSGLNEIQNVTVPTLQLSVQETEGVAFMVNITATNMCGETGNAASNQQFVPSKSSCCTFA